jgi:hypothetical protein
MAASLYSLFLPNTADFCERTLCSLSCRLLHQRVTDTGRVDQPGSHHESLVVAAPLSFDLRLLPLLMVEVTHMPS